MQIDTSQIKDKIVLTIQNKGPSLPVHISSEVNQPPLFTSAFLSELLSEKRIKTSNMRVGSSPIYFLAGQEAQLEKYSHHLKSKEKEAYMLLQNKKFLKDSVQLPAIRVALREIKDFAIPFKNNEEIFWRFYHTPIEEFNIPKKEIIVETKKPKELFQKEITPPEKINKQTEEIKKEPRTQTEEKTNTTQDVSSGQGKETLNIFDENQNEETKVISTATTKRLNGQNIPTPLGVHPSTKLRSKKPVKKKTSATEKKNEKFFNVVKEHLAKNKIQITDIIGFNKTDLILKIKKESETLLYAFNKKRIDEKDILKANKKAQELNLTYTIFSLGEPAKKITNIIYAIKNMQNLENIE